MSKKIHIERGRKGLMNAKKKRGESTSIDGITRQQYLKNGNVVLQKKILRILKTFPKGTTASHIARVIDSPHPIVRREMDVLEALREAYSVRIGNVKLFFPNGKLNHYSNFEDVRIGDRLFSFYEIVQHFNGQTYIYIQEKEPDMYRTLEIKGGVIISGDKLAEFIDSLVKFQSTLKSRKESLEIRES